MNVHLTWIEKAKKGTRNYVIIDAYLYILNMTINYPE